MDSNTNRSSAPLGNGHSKDNTLNSYSKYIRASAAPSLKGMDPTSVDGKIRDAEIKVTDQIERPPVAWEQFRVGEEPVILGTLGNFSLVIGKAKSKKSFFMKLVISAVMSGKTSTLLQGQLPEGKQRVLYFDTEQARYHVYLALQRISRMVGTPNIANLEVYCLRKYGPNERLEMIERVIQTTPRLGFVVIDGIKDLIQSINDEGEATMIASKLLEWSEERGIHIVTVLHQNKGKDNFDARGHLGTELQNKAETVLSVSQDKSNEQVSIVKSEFCRNKAPLPFAFEICDGLPQIIDDFVPEIGNSATRKVKVADWPDSKKYDVIGSIFSRVDSLSYKDLMSELKKELECLNVANGVSTVKDFISSCKDGGLLVQKEPKGPYFQGNLDLNE